MGFDVLPRYLLEEKELGNKTTASLKLRIPLDRQDSHMIFIMYSATILIPTYTLSFHLCCKVRIDIGDCKGFCHGSVEMERTKMQQLIMTNKIAHKCPQSLF